MGTLVRLWIVYSQASLGCRNWAPTNGTKVTSFLRISCKSGPATAETHRGPWAHLRKGCKNPDWFTSVLPGLPQSSAASPVPLFHCGCFRDPQRAGLSARGVEWGRRERENERGEDRIGEQEKERREKRAKEWTGEGWARERSQVTGAEQGTPNQHCVNRPPPGVDRLGGGGAGVSPPRATEAVSRADNWWQECGICS